MSTVIKKALTKRQTLQLSNTINAIFEIVDELSPQYPGTKLQARLETIKDQALLMSMELGFRIEQVPDDPEPKTV